MNTSEQAETSRSDSTASNDVFRLDSSRRSTTKSSWILRKVHDWSSRAKRQQLALCVEQAQDSSAQPGIEYDRLLQLSAMTCGQMFHGLDSLSECNRKQAHAIWEIIHCEFTFLLHRLWVLRDVYKGSLLSCKLGGYLSTVEPELLFGNLDELCQLSSNFCERVSEHLEKNKRTTPMDMLDMLYYKYAEDESVVTAYQASCINYKASIEYLESVRLHDERFAQFEKLCVLNSRARRLHLDDLLIAPLHKITRLPLLLGHALKYTKDRKTCQRINAICEHVQDALRSIDENMPWLANFDRLQHIQSQLVWPPVTDLHSRAFVPDFLKLALSRQFCENVLVHPRRRLLHEGPLLLLESQQRSIELYAFVFNDLFLLTKQKRVDLTKAVKGGCAVSEQQRYVVYRQPVPLESCVLCDVSDEDAQISQLRRAFVIIHLTRVYQVIAVYTLQAPSDADKNIWLSRFHESIESYEGTGAQHQMVGSISALNGLAGGPPSTSNEMSTKMAAAKARSID